MKKILAILLSLALVICMLPASTVTAFAETTSLTDDMITLSPASGTYTGATIATPTVTVKGATAADFDVECGTITNAGDYTVSHYEDSFLETVKEYVENGGTVIVCGLADYQDTTSGQTATETNKLLEAIGSTIRMNSDEAYDEVNNGGQPYRLY